MKTWQITLGLAVALIMALSLSVAAFAQAGLPPSNTPGASAAGYGPGTGRGGNGMRFGMNGSTLLDVTADVTGLSVTGVVAELQAGKTFAQVAQAHGKTASDLVTAFLAEREALLDQAVADGRITQAAAGTMLATMRTNVETQVNSPWQPRGAGCRFTGQQPLQGTQFRGPR